MGIFLSLSYVKLLLAVDRQVFGKSVGDILLVKENLDTFERIVIWSHAIILQIGYGVHSILGVLCKNCSKLFRAVITIVEENHHMTRTYTAVHAIIDNRLDKLIGHTFGI